MDLLTYYPTSADDPQCLQPPLARSHRPRTLEAPILSLISTDNNHLSHSTAFSVDGSDLVHGRRAKIEINITTRPLRGPNPLPPGLKAGSAAAKLGSLGMLTKVQDYLQLPCNMDTSIPVTTRKNQSTEEPVIKWELESTDRAEFSCTILYRDAETGNEKIFEPDMRLEVSRYLPHKDEWDL